MLPGGVHKASLHSKIAFVSSADVVQARSSSSNLQGAEERREAARRIGHDHHTARAAFQEMLRPVFLNRAAQRAESTVSVLVSVATVHLHPPTPSDRPLSPHQHTPNRQKHRFAVPMTLKGASPCSTTCSTGWKRRGPQLVHLVATRVRDEAVRHCPGVL